MLLAGLAGACPAGAQIASAERRTAELPNEARPSDGRWTDFASPVFRNHSIDSGLPRQASRQIVEDADGFLWVASYGGLSRWDGYRFHVYVPDPKTPGALVDNFIQVIHRDAQGRLWIGTTSSGLMRHERETDRFVSYRAGPDGLADDAIVGLADDGAGGLWVATPRGLDQLDPATGRIRPLPTVGAAPTGLPDHRVTAVLRDRKGALWVGSEGGLHRRDSEDVPFVKIAFGARATIPNTLYEDSAGRVWVGGRQGAFVVDPGDDAARAVVEAGSANPVLPGQRVMAILEVRPGLVWIATALRGIVAIPVDGAPARYILNDNAVASSLPDNTVNGLYRDRSGLIWVASARGIGYHNPVQSAVTTLFGGTSARQRISEADVSAVEVAPDGRVWLGLRNGGVDILDPATGDLLRLPPDNANPDGALPRERVFSIAAMPTGEVYVGTEKGLYRADRDGRAVARVHVAGRPPEARVDAVLPLDGMLWFGGLSGGLWGVSLDSAAAAAPPRFIAGDRLTEPRITVLQPDRDGAIWIGTWRGINRFDPSTGAIERIESLPADLTSLNRGYVSSLLVDRDGRLWVGTLAGGLGLLERRDADGRPRFRRFGPPDGLPNPSPNMLLQDRDGRIWASSDHGVAAIDPASFKIDVLREAHGVTVRNFWVHSGAKTAQNEMLFGGTGGLVVVRPDLFVKSTYEPPAVLTEVRVGGHSLPVGRLNDRRAPPSLTVSPEANAFAVEFASLDFAAPAALRYRYRLEGFDTDWTHVDSRHRLASYTNLAPGAYRLRLAGTNRDGMWSRDELTLAVTVLPAWYQTIWFRAALGVAGLMAIWLVVYARTLRLQHRRAELEALVQLRTAELVRTNEKLEIARREALDTDRRKTEFLAHMSHELRTPLNAIMGFSQMISRSIGGAGAQKRHQEYAGDILFSAEHLLSVINNILDMAKVEAGKWELIETDIGLSELLEAIRRLAGQRADYEGVTLDLVHPIPGLILHGDERTLRQILLNVVINAIKFAGTDRRVEIASARLADGGLEIRVTDRGPGMTAQELGRVLQPFESGSSRQARQRGESTGLGLPLARAFAELHGGTLTLESAPDRGTTAYLKLPAARVRLMPPPEDHSTSDHPAQSEVAKGEVS
jgi:signal transduction histidine kinase/ligand-binding sensor domain-containing protein